MWQRRAETARLLGEHLGLVGLALLLALGLGLTRRQALRQNEWPLVLTGALPAALLAVVADGLLALVAEAATPRGVR